MPDSSPPTGQSSIQDLRIDYARAALDEADVRPDPFAQFEAWFQEARLAEIPEANAMSLATVGPMGLPSARIVLLKDYDARGFTFFTNYQGRKGKELKVHPQAALCFHWQSMERQIRIEGTVDVVSREENEAYFSSRPVASQIGAWVSQQSQPIPSRAELERLQSELTARFAGAPVPLPEFWGGFRVVPQSIEFWQGRRSRLHDRILYTRTPNAWRIQRLSP